MEFETMPCIPAFQPYQFNIFQLFQEMSECILRPYFIFQKF